MASKVHCRNYKDKNVKQNARPAQSELPDELALRDEIFQLKRQIMLLKKSNERNVVKVRKYEDEAKKKDRQIEQLMDPVKNGDVRKLLSTKGAALLLNLKEQNNTLIQMILDKDMQIRKLLSEIKTSKLYASTRRTESYRNEIDRLRNLLIKSCDKSLMKDVQDAPQRRSICVGGAPALELTLASDQSSPRDLEELQFTIQSLEMHMKYSNELLAKKNEQIILLTEQLNSHRCDVCRKTLTPTYLVDSQKYSDEFLDAKRPEVESPTFAAKVNPSERHDVIPSDSTLLFDKNIPNPQTTQQDKRRLPSSAPAGPVRSARDNTPRRDSSPTCKINTFTLRKDSKGSPPAEDESGDNREDVNPVIAADNRTEKTWLRVQETNSSQTTELPRIYLANETDNKTSRTASLTEESDIDTAEFEMMEKKIEDDQAEVESPVKLAPALPSPSEVGGCETPSEGPAAGDVERDFQGECDRIEAEEILTGNCDQLEKDAEAFDFRLNRESSFDSDSTTASTHELEVEAEINHDSCDVISDDGLAGNDEDDDGDDDDDVIVG